MKPGILPLLAFLAGTAALMAACSKQAEPPAPTAAPEKTAEPESRVKHGTNGEVIVTLDAAIQKVMGLETAPLGTVRLSPEVKGYGRILDAASLASLVADLVTAQAASDLSAKELSRLRTLAGENNASERALQAAEAAAVRDQAQVESVRLRLLANWGGAIAGRPDLAAFVQSLVTLSNALVQLDLPAGEAVQATPTAARLVTLADNTAPIDAQFLGPAPVVDPQMQGRGFLFLVSPNASRLTPGASVTGYLRLPGEARIGLMVPRPAILRFNGATWVYVQTGDDTFQREEVTLDRPLAEGWFVREGLRAEDKVVTAGAQQLLSEELKGPAEP